MYSLLSGKLPVASSVTHGEISWKYRDMIEIEKIMFDDELEAEKKLQKSLLIFYGCMPQDVERAIEELLWFFYCGKDKKDDKGQKNTLRSNGKRAYDFEIDAPYIYAAFMEQYGINLLHEDNLHWWEFMAMFDCLNENTKMSRIIYYRTVDTNGMPDKQRKFIFKMRALYEIKNPDSDLSNEMKLAKRNSDMKAYVERRMRECPQKK